MKIIVASTPEQDQHITELIDYLYSSIFPFYFEDEYILKLSEMKVLTPNEEDMYYNKTLDKAFKVISSLQTITAILETIQYEGFQEEHRVIFEKNANILNEFGYLFPFTPDDFRTINHGLLSKFSKTEQQYLA